MEYGPREFIDFQPKADLCTLRILRTSVVVTEFNPEYGNTDLLIWLRTRLSPKYGNAHHLNIFFTVISSVKNVAPSVGNVHVPLYYARCQATRNTPQAPYPVLTMLSIMLAWDITRWRRTFPFIMLDARPRATYLRPRNLY